MTDEKNNNDSLVPARKDAPASFKVKAVGLAAKKQALAAKRAAEGVPTEIEPSKAEHKVGIIFDDSASMSGTKINDAHAGTEEFLRSCNPSTTAIAIYPMNPEDGHSNVPLTTKMYAAAITVKTWEATGSTPLFHTLDEMMKSESLTRGIIFSDGSPNYDDERLMDAVLTKAVEKKLPVDTVFIGHDYDTHAIEIMKTIAERTGGIFLKFDPNKSNFRTAFKYLSPGYRAMLMDKSFVEKLQEGKV